MTNSYDPELLSIGDDILEHYGVKGMRWGVRKDKRNDNKKPGKVKRAINKTLDDADIPGRPNRRSNRLTDAQKAKENSGRAKAGKIILGSLLVGLGTYQVYRVAKDVSAIRKARSGAREAAKTLREQRETSAASLFKNVRPEFAARSKNFSVETNNADAFRITMEEMARRRKR